MKLFSRKARPLKTRLLKQYRNEAYSRLRFMGSWSGWFETRIDGICYRSESVSGFKYVVGDYLNFLQDSIIDRVKLRRNPKAFKREIEMSRMGGYRYVCENGEVEQWHI